MATARQKDENQVPDSRFAFPDERKEPLTDARHVRNAVARFDQVTDVSDSDRELAFANIKKAAQHYGVELGETSWQDLGKHPQRNRTTSAGKGAATRKRTGTAKRSGRKAAATRKKTARKTTTRKRKR